MTLVQSTFPWQTKSVKLSYVRLYLCKHTTFTMLKRNYLDSLSRPLKVIALNAPEPAQIKPFGFMAGQIQVPNDFDQMGEEEIIRIFEEGA